MGLNLEAEAGGSRRSLRASSQAQAIVVAEYRGLEVAAHDELRAKARQSGVYLRVLKNTLARRAVAGDAVREAGRPRWSARSLYGISAATPSPARRCCRLREGERQFVIKGGAMPNCRDVREGRRALATLPSREELLAS